MTLWYNILGKTPDVFCYMNEQSFSIDKINPFDFRNKIK
jgi:hypothetical protein